MNIKKDNEKLTFGGFLFEAVNLKGLKAVDVENS